MTHARTTIREWVAATLTGLPATGTRVHSSRVHRYAAHQLPALNVLTGREEAAEGGTRDSDYRELEVEIEALDKLTQGLDAALDQMALEIEGALVSATRPANVLAIAYERAEINIEGEADQPSGLMRIVYSVLYRVPPGHPVL